MNFQILTYLFVLLLISQIANCESKSSDDEEKQRVIAGLVVSRSLGTGSSSSSTVNITCSDSAPAFSTLATAGVSNSTTGCARSGCHVGSSPQNGLDMTSYSSVITKVTAKNGSGSLLFQKINGGSMQAYTTTAITNAIYCWIQGGALP